MKKNNWLMETNSLKIKLQTIIRKPDNGRAYLYHYTNAEGLAGILRTNSMWATNTRFLNDPRELKYARDIIKGELENRIKLAKNKTFEYFWQKLLDKFEQLYKEIDIYIICFCENGDLLSQWRGYGSQGGGYSIGFKREMIQNIGYNIKQNKYILSKVEYSPKKQSEIINEILDVTASCIESVEKIASNDKLNAVVNRVVAIVSKVLLYQIARFKHETFQEENEWRIIYLIDNQDEYTKDNFNFRFKNGIAIPYIVSKLSKGDMESEGKLPIFKIFFGPSLETPIVLKSLDLMKKKFGYGKVLIKNSAISYSNWQ